MRHEDDRYSVWAYRLLLAQVSNNADGLQDTVHEIVEANGCWACLAREALTIAEEAFYDHHGEAVVTAVERALQTELDEHE